MTCTLPPCSWWFISVVRFSLSLGCCGYTYAEVRVSEGRDWNWSGWAPFDTLGVTCVLVIITIRTTDQVREGLGVQREQDCPENRTLWNPRLKGAGRGKTSAVCENMELPAVSLAKDGGGRKRADSSDRGVVGQSLVSRASSANVEQIRNSDLHAFCADGNVNCKCR